MKLRTMQAFVAAAGLAALAGCSSYGTGGVRAGDSADAVAKAMGAPTGRYALPQGGTRLEYARGPYGKHTFMVDLDAQGRVSGWHQVLTEPNFNEVRSGWSQDDLLMRLGRPSERRSGGRQGGEVWSYRYDAVFCQWFQVSVKDGRVGDTAYAPDPLCDIDRPDGPAL